MRAGNTSNDEHTKSIVDLKYEKTVAALKQAIEKETGIPREHQLLRDNSSSGEVLKDGKTLKNVGLEKANVFLSFGELKILVNYEMESFTIRVDGTDNVASVKKAIREIFGIMPKEQTFAIRVDKTDTVATLKKAIKERFGILPKEQTLRFNNTFGLALEDEQTMEEYGIKDGQNVLLSLDEFQIVVRYGMKRHSVNVKGTDTVATLKERIENIKEFGNIPPKQQILIRHGGSMFDNDSKTMDKCRVKKDETFIVTWNEFEISVKYDEKEEPITVKVKYDDKLNSLKDIIKKEFGISPEKQKLRYSSEYLSEKLGDTIYVTDPVQIKVKINGNDSHCVDVEVKGKDTVKIVKETIKAAIKLKWDVNFEEGSKMELHTEYGNIFDNVDKTIEAYGIKEGDKICGEIW
ncbi:hypothetical protein niasHT_024870 [Heterodera trifolii]|uniref:Ubiquitin-like domain-containing protein n=1 Tax=Heterodera trifolii TaxID=157864 RepID=A0ABD2JGQ3_9BILA